MDTAYLQQPQIKMKYLKKKPIQGSEEPLQLKF